MWGIIPAAGIGSRIQPLAFSKELLPVGITTEGSVERPKAVSEYLVERMIRGGVTKICFVISPSKLDIVSYFGAKASSAPVYYAVQQRPSGICDAVFRALPLIHPGESVVIGLPDTIWFPVDGLCNLGNDSFSFLLFPVDHPEHFDAVITNPDGRVTEIQVKSPQAGSRWIWGAFKFPGEVLHDLYRLWCDRDKCDEYVGALVNAYIERGGEVRGVPAGRS